MTDADTPVISAEVADAIAIGAPVVALESTIFSELGLPAPANAEALERCIAAVRDGGAVPAVTAVLDGRARVGVDPAEHERICGPATKTAERDLPVAVATGVAYGATTVSAAVSLAAAANVAVFATGGIGGVHRGVEISGDVSADLPAIASTRWSRCVRGRKRSLTLVAPSNTSRPSAYQCSAGGTMISRRSTFARVVIGCRIGWNTPQRSRGSIACAPAMQQARY